MDFCCEQCTTCQMYTDKRLLASLSCKKSILLKIQKEKSIILFKNCLFNSKHVVPRGHSVIRSSSKTTTHSLPNSDNLKQCTTEKMQLLQSMLEVGSTTITALQQMALGGIQLYYPSLSYKLKVVTDVSCNFNQYNRQLISKCMK